MFSRSTGGTITLQSNAALAWTPKTSLCVCLELVLLILVVVKGGHFSLGGPYDWRGAAWGFRAVIDVAVTRVIRYCTRG